MLVDESALQPGLYRLPEDPIGPRVLVPGFRSATSVRAAFGWFSAGWIERLAPGLAEYLSRPDTNPIRFTVAPIFFPEELHAVKQGSAMTAEEAAQRVANVFVEGRVNASVLGQHALDCLAWMVAADRLRLRIAVPKSDSNYHPKIWLFDDGTDQVLVRGSANATGRGLSGGVEHMDVDVSWNELGRDRVATGIGILDDWEQGISLGIEQTVDLPDALRNDIIKTAPAAAPTPDHYLQAADESSAQSWAIERRDPLGRLRSRFARDITSQDRPRLTIPDGLEWQSGDYSHQAEAVTAWETEPDPERGTISMATGAGKTLAALICATRAQDRLGDTPLLIVVSVPSTPLITQWVEEVKGFGITAVAPTQASDKNVAISRLLQLLSGGGTHIAVVTNNLLCDSAFQNTVSSHVQNASRPLATMLIGDEAHTLGAASFIGNKPEFFERRLALSATPERQYDPDGTEEIFEFFGPPVYEFGLERAIGFCLVPYDYYVHVTTLDGDELDEFKELTDRIRRLVFRLKDEDDDRDLISLCIRRRRIIETAESKIPLLSSVLSHRGPRSLKKTLVYASAKNPEQFDNIAQTLTDFDVRWAPVTQETTANTKHLDKTLATFATGGFQVLLAKKVLDEGVDIPSIREAFLVASSAVEREWVQRRGRVLRRHPGKPWAVLHDFVALPPADLFAQADDDLKKIVQSELSRAYSFAAHARNATGNDGVLAHLEQIRNSYWSTNGGISVLKSAGDYLIAPSTPEGDRW